MEEKVYKWRWSGYSSTRAPERKQVLRETESTIWYVGENWQGKQTNEKERKWTDYHKWFDTWQEWHMWMIEKATCTMERASKDLEAARDRLAKVQAMVEPDQD